MPLLRRSSVFCRDADGTASAKQWHTLSRRAAGLLTRSILAAALLSLGGCSSQVDPQHVGTFAEAQAAFDRADRTGAPEDFLQAAGLYQEMLDRGVASAAVFYNQGNAFMRAGRRGRAVAAYRQAERYWPRDPRLQENLRVALQTDDPSHGSRPLIEYVLFWQSWLGYAAKFRLFGVAVLLTFALATAGLFVERRRLFRAAIAALLLTALLGLSAGYDWYRYDVVRHGVIVEPEVIARKGNAESYEPAFTEALGEGTEFRLSERRGDWLLLQFSAGGEGWVEEDVVVVY